MATEQASTNPHPEIRAHIAQDLPGIRILINHKLAIKNFYARCLGPPDGETLFNEFTQKLLSRQLEIESGKEGNWRQAIQTLTIQALIQHQSSPSDDEDFEADLQSKFQLAWRQSLLTMAWNQLKELQDNFGKRFYTVLKSRVKHSNWSTEKLYKSMLESGDAVCGPSAFKECLTKAHTTYAKFLFSEVLNTLSHPSELQVRAELQLLGLHHFFPAYQSGSHGIS